MKLKLTGKASYNFRCNGELLNLKEKDEIEIAGEEYTKLKMKDYFIVISEAPTNEKIKTENEAKKDTNKETDKPTRQKSYKRINKAVKEKVKSYKKQKNKTGSKKC